MKKIKAPKGYLLIEQIPEAQRNDFIGWMSGQTVMGDTIGGKDVFFYNRTDYEKFYDYWKVGKVAPVTD